MFRLHTTAARRSRVEHRSLIRRRLMRAIRALVNHHVAIAHGTSHASTTAAPPENVTEHSMKPFAIVTGGSSGVSFELASICAREDDRLCPDLLPASRPMGTGA
jgi:hypothetical protein